MLTLRLLRIVTPRIIYYLDITAFSCNEAAVRSNNEHSRDCPNAHYTFHTPDRRAPGGGRVTRLAAAPRAAGETPARGRGADQISELLGARTLPAVTVACRRAASNLRPSDYGRASTGIIDRRGRSHLD